MDLVIYIDDRLSASASREQAKLDSLILYGLMAACGWLVSLEKSVISPVRSVAFLRLLVDFALAQFRVPEERLKLPRKQLMKVLEDPAAITPKEMASIAGRIGSTRMAVPVAPWLLCWGLYRAIKTVLGEPQLVRTPAQLREILNGLSF